MKFYIADTSVFLFKMKPPEMCITTPSVVAEVKDSSSSMFLELSCSEEINIEVPKEKMLEQIKKVAEQSGDLEQLSTADVDVLAKALEYKPLSIILTDDYRIQNVARILEIPVQPLQQKPIKQTYKWINVCTGCGQTSERGGICQVCGAPIRRRRIKVEE